MAKLVYEHLEEAEDEYGTPEAVIEALKEMGELASQHIRGKVYT